MEFHRRPSASHALLLFESSRSAAAHAEFLRLADNLLENAASYRKQAALKRQEALNVLIFAGRVAALDKDNQATIDAFRRVIAIRDTDYDARKFIGQQFREVGNLQAALREFQELSGLTAAKRLEERRQVRPGHSLNINHRPNMTGPPHPINHSN